MVHSLQSFLLLLDCRAQVSQVDAAVIGGEAPIESAAGPVAGILARDGVGHGSLDIRHEPF